MLRVATIAAATLGIIMAMVSVAGGEAAFSLEPKPDKQAKPVYVVAPINGIFWRGAWPGARPFTEVGDIVEANAVVAQIEHMRITKLTAGTRGAVVEFLVADGQLVKAMQPLVKIVPKPIEKEQKAK